MRYLKYNKTVECLKKDIPNSEVLDKEYSVKQKVLCKLLSPFKYSNVWTAIYPKIWRPITTDLDRKHNYRTVQHEWVHLKDAQTLMGFSPKKLVKLNVLIFSILYAFPQWLALFSLLSLTGNLFWLLSLMFLLPLPAPFRTWAELRAYRRSVELESDPDKIANSLSSIKYYFAMPFKKKTKELLTKPSPYKEEMDKALILD